MALSCSYIDDGLMGADPICEAIQLWKEVRDLFTQLGFKLKCGNQVKEKSCEYPGGDQRRKVKTRNPLQG